MAQAAAAPTIPNLSDSIVRRGTKMISKVVLITMVVRNLGTPIAAHRENALRRSVPRRAAEIRQRVRGCSRGRHPRQRMKMSVEKIAPNIAIGSRTAMSSLVPCR